MACARSRRRAILLVRFYIYPEPAPAPLEGAFPFPPSPQPGPKLRWGTQFAAAACGAGARFRLRRRALEGLGAMRHYFHGRCFVPVGRGEHNLPFLMLMASSSAALTSTAESASRGGHT